MLPIGIRSRQTKTDEMQSKEKVLSINIKQPPRSQWHREQFLKACLVVLALLLFAIGRLLLSWPRYSDDGTSSIDASFNMRNESLGSPMNGSAKLSDMHFLGAPGPMDLPFFDSGSMTAILPVINSSLEQLQHIIEDLVTEESSISAITLVCPVQVVPALNSKFLGGPMDTFIDIHVAIWPEGLDEGSALLNIASQVSTEYALIIDSGGFDGLSEESREGLLSHPLLLDVPSGFCGGSFSESGSQAVCAISASEPYPASFLLPPFVIPASLIRGFNWTANSDENSWMSLGKALSHISEAGAVVRESERESDRDWCRSLCQKVGSILDDQPQCSSSKNSGDPLERKGDPSQSSSLAIILQTVSDLEAFSSVACRLFQNGYSTHVLILSYESDHFASHDNSFPWLHDHLISGVCNISYSALHGSTNSFANAEAVTFWLESADEVMSVIIYESGKLVSAIEYPYDAALEKQSASGVTVIKIPQSDISYCDWIGSLSLAELRNWHAPQVEVSVITDDRPTSLTRLLTSLTNAVYFGDSVAMRINVEQTADLETRRLVDAFRWDQGPIFVHHRVVHAGLLTAVVESWYPRSNHSYGVLLEDDVEVSRLFYAWIKMSLLRYRYGSESNRRLSLFGISLYQQKQIELRPEGRRPFDAQALFDMYGILYRNTPYLSQIPCSWGAVYFPEHWREFHTYLVVRFSEAWLPLRDHVVPHVRSNRWAKSWKRFFIELVFLRGYVMLYPNYDDFVSLSTNHLELGSHVKKQPRRIYEQKKALFTLPLMTLPESATELDDSRATELLDLPEEQLPAWSDLPVLDLFGQLSSEAQIGEHGKERQNELVGCTTVANVDERRRPFEAEELFICSDDATEESEIEDELDSGESL